MNLLHSINDFNEAKQVIVGGVNSPVRAFGSVGGVPRFIQNAKKLYKNTVKNIRFQLFHYQIFMEVQ